jgi:hypothetical protein
MRRKLGYTQLRCELLNHKPDHLLCHALTPSASRKASEQSPTSDPSSPHPSISDLLDPVWNRDSSDMTRFPNQVDCPVIFALLQMIKGQSGQLTTSSCLPGGGGWVYTRRHS